MTSLPLALVQKIFAQARRPTELKSRLNHQLLPSPSPHRFSDFTEAFLSLLFSLLCSLLQVVTSVLSLLTSPELFCRLARQMMSSHFALGVGSPRYLHASFRVLCFDPGREVIIDCVCWQTWRASTLPSKLVSTANATGEDLRPPWQATRLSALPEACGNRGKIRCWSWLIALTHGVT